MQQDTFWRGNLFELNLDDNLDYDAIFDQIGNGEHSQRAGWVNGNQFLLFANSTFWKEQSEFEQVYKDRRSV